MKPLYAALFALIVSSAAQADDFQSRRAEFANSSKASSGTLVGRWTCSQETDRGYSGDIPLVFNGQSVTYGSAAGKLEAKERGHMAVIQNGAYYVAIRQHSQRFLAVEVSESGVGTSRNNSLAFANRIVIAYHACWKNNTSSDDSSSNSYDSDWYSSDPSSNDSSSTHSSDSPSSDSSNSMNPRPSGPPPPTITTISTSTMVQTADGRTIHMNGPVFGSDSNGTTYTRNGAYINGSDGSVIWDPNGPTDGQ